MSTIAGFLLCRQWRDAPEGLLLWYWLQTDSGPVLLEQTQQQGVFFVEQTDLAKALMLCKNTLARTQALSLKSFSQHPVHGFYFNQQRQLKQAAALLKRHGIEALEADVRTVDRFLMERFITASMSFSGENSRQQTNLTILENARIKAENYTPQLRVISFDIETALDGSQLYSIAVYGEDTSQVFMLGDSALNNGDCYADERSLLLAFMAWLHDYDPDILIGWNCVNFDLRFLEKCCRRLSLSLSLGRNYEPLEWRTSHANDEHYFVLVPGRAVLDGIDMLKAATHHFESFALQFVAQALLSKGKLIQDVDNRGSEITHLFEHDKQALADYNLEDCVLVWEIFEATGLIPFAIERARLTGLPLDKVGGSVAAFENQYLPRLHRQGYVAPNLPVNPEGVGSPGGYVMASRPGIYQHVLVLDFKSLYPSIIRSFLVDPFGLVEGDRLLTAADETRSIDSLHAPPDFTDQDYDKQQFTKGFRGAFFKKQDSILPSLIERLWQARDQAKADHNPALSQAIKILMNSFYGVMGTPGCRFFDPRLPSSITLRGHEIMNQTRALIESQGFQVIYGDTDSIFVWLDRQVTGEEAEGIGEHLARTITQWWRQHLSEQYQLNSALELEFENHFTRFLMPTIRGSQEGSKKRYAGMVCAAGFDQQKQGLDKSGKPLYQMVYKGLETVRSDWTPLAREFQQGLYERIFLEQDYQPYILTLIEELRSGKHDAKLHYRKRIRRMLADYQRNIPPHVQAALKADAWLQSQHQPSRYHRGGWIEYAYTLNGPEALECLQSPLDYDLYVTRQIAPIVDGIVGFLGTSFEAITTRQITLL